MKKIIRSIIVLSGVLLLSVICFFTPQKVLETEDDYCIVSQNVPAHMRKIWFGNQLTLFSPDKKQTIARAPIIQGGFTDYSYSDGYLCYKTIYSGSSRLLREKYDTDKLYICNLMDKSGGQDVIEEAECYVLGEGKLIYESTSGDLFYYDIDRKKKERIDWEWEQYSEGLYHIRWRNEESFYITDSSGKRLYCYSVKDKSASLIFESDKMINGIIPYQQDEVIIYGEAGLLKKRIGSDKKPSVLTEIENTVYKSGEGENLEDNVAGCPFAVGENGELYYDNNGYIWEYDMKSGSAKKMIDLRKIPGVNLDNENSEISYKIGRDSIMVAVSLKKELIFSFYDYTGELKKRYEMPYPGWETSSYNRNRGA